MQRLAREQKGLNVVSLKKKKKEAGLLYQINIYTRKSTSKNALYKYVDITENYFLLLSITLASSKSYLFYDKDQKKQSGNQ